MGWHNCCCCVSMLVSCMMHHISFRSENLWNMSTSLLIFSYVPYTSHNVSLEQEMFPYCTIHKNAVATPPNPSATFCPSTWDLPLLSSPPSLIAWVLSGTNRIQLLLQNCIPRYYCHRKFCDPAMVLWCHLSPYFFVHPLITQSLMNLCKQKIICLCSRLVQTTSQWSS